MKKLLLSVFLVLNSLCYAGRIKNETKVTSNQEKVILNTFKECGFEGEVKVIKHDEMLDGLYSEKGKGYRVDFRDGAKNVTLYLKENGDIESIRYITINFYKDGKVLDNAKDYVVSFNEASDYNIRCMHVIKSLLISPSTAKFPNINHWAFVKKKGILTIQSYVDSQNAYGAMIRSNFQFIIDTKGQNIQSLIIDGQEFMKK